MVVTTLSPSPVILLHTVSLNVEKCGEVGVLVKDGCTQSHWMSKSIDYFKQTQSNWILFFFGERFVHIFILYRVVYHGS